MKNKDGGKMDRRNERRNGRERRKERWTRGSNDQNRIEEMMTASEKGEIKMG